MRPNYNSLFVRVYALAISLAIGLGVAISMGKGGRFSGETYIGPRALFSWAPLPAHWIWAAIFFIYGAWLLYGFGRRVAVHALRVGIALYLFWAVGFIDSLLADPKAAAPEIVAYLVFSGVHLLLADHLYNRGWEGC